MNSRQGRNEKGQSIIIVTLMIIILMAMAGLSIDVGRLYTTRQQLQGYTDAATLAGTRQLPYGNEASDLIKSKVDLATQRALQTYAHNVGVDIAALPDPPYSYSPAWNRNGENMTLSYDMVHGTETDHVVVTVFYHDELTIARGIPKERAMLVEASRDVPMIFGSLLGPPVAKASRPAGAFKSVFEVKWKFNTQADVHGTPLYAVDSVDGKEMVFTVSKSGYIFALDAWGEQGTGRTYAYWKFKVLENGLGERTLCYPYTSKYFCEPPEGESEGNNAIIGSSKVTRRVDRAEQCGISTTCWDFTAWHSIDNGDGTTTLVYQVCSTNDAACNHGLSNVAFSLPTGQTASWPTNNYQGFKSYSVENPTNNPFYSIKFETLGEGIKNGQCDTFQWTLPSAVAQYAVQVQAKASTYSQGGTFENNCSFRDPVDMGQDVVLFTSYPKSNDTNRGYLYALDVHTGDKAWASYVGQRQYQKGAYSGGQKGQTDGVSYIDSTPAFSPDGSVVYYASRDGRLYAYEVGDGSAVWPDCDTSSALVNSCVQLAAGTVSTPVVDPTTGIIYVATSRQRDGSGSGSPKNDRGVIYAISPSGTIRWTWYPSRTGYGFDSSPVLWPATHPTALYIGGRDTYLYKLNPSTGALIWEYQTPTSLPGQPSGNPQAAVSSTPAIEQQGSNVYIYFSTEKGAGIKLRDDGASPAWEWGVWLGYDIDTTASPPGNGSGNNVRRMIHGAPGLTSDFVYYGVVTEWDQECAFQAVRKSDGVIFQSFVMENDTHSTLRVAANNWLYYASCDNYTYGVDTNPSALDSRLIR